ncbi:MAG: hypothetical protein U9O98_01720 [Asgard group archaeon]|nr:hypothetical protein [Asgard group archaeon]
MDFESPHSPSKAIERAEKYLKGNILNAIIKEKPLNRQEKQKLEVGVTGGRWEFFWIKIYAQKNLDKGSKITLRANIGLQQLTFSAIILLLAGPFLYFAISNPTFFTIFVPSILALFGFLGILVPIIRLRKTTAKLKQAIQSTNEIEVEEKIAEQKKKSRLSGQ